jgi:hypothetical protein
MEHSSASRCLVESDSTAAATLTAQTQGRQTSGDRGYDAESIRQGLRDTHHPSSCEAQYRAWQRIGAMAMGGRTDFRLAESIPATAGALRKAG